MNSNIRDAGNFLLSRPLAVLRASAAQSIPNTTWTGVTLDVEDIDRDNGHSTVSNTSRYTSATPGYFLWIYTVDFLNHATGRRIARIRANGADNAQTGGGRMVIPNANPTDTAMTGSLITYVNGTTDYVEMMAWQDSGGALNTYVAADAGSRLHALWVSS